MLARPRKARPATRFTVWVLVVLASALPVAGFAAGATGSLAAPLLAHDGPRNATTPPVSADVLSPPSLPVAAVPGSAASTPSPLLTAPDSPAQSAPVWESGSVTTTVAMGPPDRGQPEGVVYDGGNGDVYVVGGSPGSVTVVDSATNAVVATVPVGPAPADAAVDTANGDLYITVSGQDQVRVIDGTTNQALGAIPVGGTPLGTAFDPADGEIYVSNSATGNVSVIDGGTDTVVGTVTVGSEPTAVTYDGANGDLYVTDNGSGAVSVIRGSTNTVVATIGVGSGPAGATFDSGNGNVYVANQGSDSVSVIRASNNSVAATVSGFSGPQAVACDVGNGDVYVTDEDSNTVGVIGGSTNSLVATVPVGAGPDGAAYAGSTGDVYIANQGAASLSVISTLLMMGGITPYLRGVGSLGVAAPAIPVGESPNSAVYEGANGNVYVTDNRSDSVSVINASTDSVVATVPVGGAPEGVAYDGEDGDLYVANTATDNVSVISAATNRVVATIPVGEEPSSDAYDAGDGDVYVTNVQTNNVTVIDGTTNTVAGSVPVGNAPDGSAYDSANGEVFVVNRGSSTVSIIDGATNTVGATLPVGASAEGAAFDFANGDVYISNFGSDNVSLIDGTTNTIVGAIPVGSHPLREVWDSANGDVFVTNSGSDNVSVIDGTSNAVVASLSSGPDPTAVAYASDHGNLLIADSGQSDVSDIPTLTDSTSPSSPLLDVGQSLLVGAPLGGAGTGRLEVTLTSSDSAALRCAPNPLDANGVSGACFGNLTGNYTLTLALTDSDGNTVVSSLGISVVSDPTVSRVTASPPALDVGQTTSLSAAAIGGSAGFSYAWSGLPVGCIDSDAPTLVCTPTVAASDSVYVTVTDSDGFALASAATPLLVSVDPAVEAVIALPPAVDIDQPVVFVAKLADTGSGTAATDNYSWAGLPVNCQSEDALRLTCLPGAAGTYSVVFGVSDPNGWNVTSAAVTLVVSPDLELNDVAASLATITVGQTVIFTASVTGGTGAYYFVWTGLPSGCTSANTPALACTPNGTAGSPFSVTVTVADSDGASVSASSPLVSVTRTGPGSGGSPPIAGVTSSDWIAISLGLVALVLSLVAIAFSERRSPGSGELPAPGFPPEASPTEWEPTGREGTDPGPGQPPPP
ncbi:MAG: hypothetical protein WBE40_08955 [Thermoplasmata archaeon]